MKRLLASLVFVLSACSAASAAVELPQPLYADGTSFALPCPEHGSHLQTITAHTVGVVYTIKQDDGSEAQVPEILLQQVLEAFGVAPSEESGQQTPEDTLDLPAGPVQPPAGGGTSPTGNR